MNENFWAGFEKQAFSPAAAFGHVRGLVNKIPSAASNLYHDIPGHYDKAKGAVKDYAAHNARAMDVANKRAGGMVKATPEQIASGAAKGKMIRPDGPIKTPNFSKQVEKGRINTGLESPEAIKKSKGTLLNKAQNVATAVGVGTGVGAYYGMKDKNEQQQSQQYR